MAKNFDNWRLSVESEYLSMYIKTWFAFLATAKELYPEAITNTGDGGLIKAYQAELDMPANYHESIRGHIEKLYGVSQSVIEKDFPDSFLSYFFKVNKGFCLEIDNGTYQVKISYRDKYEGKKNANLHITYKSIAKKFSQNLGSHVVQCNVFINDLIQEKAFRKYDDGINLIQRVMLNAGEVQILTLDKVKNKEARKGYLRDQLTPMMQLIRQEFKFSDLFQPQPLAGFPTEYKPKDDTLSGEDLLVLKWFVNFNYHLRNILFHHVLDPFDQQWLDLFKHAYLALQELVILNIAKIQEK